MLDSATQRPIADASVVILSDSGLIYQFAFTNDSGRFSITIADGIRTERLRLSASIIGYATAVISLHPLRNSYKILLRPTVKALQEVVVKDRKPLVIKDDTLSYDVKKFSQPEDRSIGDVIRRIPGVTVDGDGSISYNGRAISNLFIQGDDLMDGRYGAATRTIPKDQISSIDILLNHQPINVLRGKMHSDDIAINLTLKDPKRMKMSGNATVGGGAPSLFDGEVSTILLNERIKMLNAIKTNNTGVGYENEILQHTREKLLRENGTTKSNRLLSSALAPNPDIPQAYYYRNNSTLFNLNNLFKTKDSIQLSMNFNALIDKNNYEFEKRLGNIVSTGDTIVFDESQQVTRRLHGVNGTLTIQANKKHSFVSNNLRIMYDGNSENSTLIFNRDSFPQRLRSDFLDVSNDFSMIPGLRTKNLLRLNWYVHYRRRPEQLNIFRGIHQQVLNNGQLYRDAEQSVSLPSFFSNASASYFVINQSRLRQLYKLNLITEIETLKSAISLHQLDGSKTLYAGDQGNNITWNRHLLQASAEYTYEQDSWRASVSIPATVQQITFAQRGLPNLPPTNRLLFNPKIDINFYVNREDIISFNYSFENRFGDIRQIYQGLMLVNFRFLNLNTPVVQELKNSSFQLRYDLKRAIKLFTASAQLKFDRISANTLPGSVFSDNVQQTIQLPIPNNQNRLSATAQLSKFFFQPKIKISSLVGWSRDFDNQIINNFKRRFANDAFFGNFSLEGTIKGKFAYQYSGSFFRSRSFEPTSNPASISNRFRRLEQYLSFGYTFKQLFATVKVRQITARQSGLNPILFYATDATLRYRLKKMKSEITLDVTNLLNQKEYGVFAVSSNQFSVTSYPLRTRMIIGRFSFNF
ncbi:MAG: TonB-dependent receptor [Chitinophagaceae bacterium]|nr:TonB-dependent receptor [Chitinophagaceae bacterium]